MPLDKLAHASFTFISSEYVLKSQSFSNYHNILVGCSAAVTLNSGTKSRNNLLRVVSMQPFPGWGLAS